MPANIWICIFGNACDMFEYGFVRIRQVAKYSIRNWNTIEAKTHEFWTLIFTLQKFWILHTCELINIIDEWWPMYFSLQHVNISSWFPADLNSRKDNKCHSLRRSYIFTFIRWFRHPYTANVKSEIAVCVVNILPERRILLIFCYILCWLCP